MTRHPSKHRNRVPSREYNRSNSRELPASLGRYAAAHTSIIASTPGHKVGLHKTSKEHFLEQPEYLGSTQAEMLADALIESVLGNKTVDSQDVNAYEAGELFMQSIDENDPEEVVALKQISAKMCGTDNAGINYQKTIAALDERMSADELRDFALHIYEWSHENSTDSDTYINEQMSGLSGFRVEASFIKLIRAAGFNIINATHDEDLHGIDFWVNGVPFDLKSSENTALWHIKKHEKSRNRYHAVKFVPPFTASDFDGRLVIPDENVQLLLQTSRFQEMVEDAIETYTRINNQTATQ